MTRFYGDGCPPEKKIKLSGDICRPLFTLYQMNDMVAENDVLKAQEMPAVNVSVEHLYVEAFPIVARFVAKMNGTLEDARDVFQDAVVIYLEQYHLATNDIEDHQRYLLGIAKHLWLKNFRRSHRLISLDSFESALRIPDDYFPDVRSELLLKFLESTGRRCLDLLKDFYYEKFSIRRIAEDHGFGSEHSASVQKYKCIEKMRESVKSKSLSYEDFFD